MIEGARRRVRDAGGTLLEVEVSPSSPPPLFVSTLPFGASLKEDMGSDENGAEWPSVYLLCLSSPIDIPSSVTGQYPR